MGCSIETLAAPRFCCTVCTIWWWPKIDKHSCNEYWTMNHYETSCNYTIELNKHAETDGWSSGLIRSFHVITVSFQVIHVIDHVISIILGGCCFIWPCRIFELSSLRLCTSMGSRACNPMFLRIWSNSSATLRRVNKCSRLSSLHSSMPARPGHQSNPKYANRARLQCQNKHIV